MPITSANIPAGFTAVRPTEDEVEQLLALDTWAFPSPIPAAELRSWPLPLDLARTQALREQTTQQFAALHGSYAFARFPVPGATTAAAGLTWVGVHPQYRRRGLLRSMIQTHLADCRSRGEAISALTATEPAIYGRFGYGLASRTASVSIPRGSALRLVAGSDEITITIEIYQPQRHSAWVAELHPRAGLVPINRPGWVTRETTPLRDAFDHDPEALRDGFESKRIMLAWRGEQLVGYALFRRKLAWNDRGADGTVMVIEYVAPDAATTHALWSRLLDFDLTTTVRQRLLSLDDPVLSILVDQRAATPRISDNVWVRVIDVAAALTARRYAAAVDVTFDLTDPLLPDNAGCWRLQAEAFTDQIELSRCSSGAIQLDAAALGSLYLGGQTATALADAGRISGDPATIAAMSAAFSWPRQPATSWVF